MTSRSFRGTTQSKGANINDYGAFGELLVAEPRPQVQIHPVYGLRSDVRKVEQNGATVTTEANEFRTRTGTTAFAVGAGIAKRPLVYRSGQGALARFTGKFDAGQTGAVLGAGLFSNSEGLYFGYFNDQFSIFHTRDAKASVQTLTLTAAGNGAESALLTIDGTAYNVPLALTTVEGNAYELAEALNGTVTNWEFTQVDNTLVFNQTVPLVTTGVFTYTSSGTSAGSIVENQAGVDTTNTIIPQTSWNINTFPNLNPQNYNVFQVKYQYLGAGVIEFGIENPQTGGFDLVHRIEWPNANTVPTLGNPSLFVGWLARSIGGTADLSVYGASAFSAIEGDDDAPTNFNKSAVATQTVTTTEQSHLVLQNRATFGNVLNLSIVEPEVITVANDATKSCIVNIYTEQALTNATNFTYVDAVDSVMLKSVVQSPLAAPVGSPLVSFTVAGAESASFDLSRLQNEILANERLVITTKLTSGSADSVTVSVLWKEIS